MTLDAAQSWVIIISSLAAAAIGIITALKVGQVHTLVNSAMAEQKTENAMLRGLLVTKQLEIDTAERVRVTLATEAAASGAGMPLPGAEPPPSGDAPTVTVPGTAAQVLAVDPPHAPRSL